MHEPREGFDEVHFVGGDLEARACRVAVMPDSRRLRSARSSSVIDIAIGILLVNLGERLPERLVRGEIADRRVRLRERHGRGRARLAFERTPDAGAGERAGLREARTHRLDLGARVLAHQVCESVDRALARTAEACEELSAGLGRRRADGLQTRQEARGFTRWVDSSTKQRRSLPTSPHATDEEAKLILADLRTQVSEAALPQKTRSAALWLRCRADHPAGGHLLALAG